MLPVLEFRVALEHCGSGIIGEVGLEDGRVRGPAALHRADQQRQSLFPAALCKTFSTRRSCIP